MKKLSLILLVLIAIACGDAPKNEPIVPDAIQSSGRSATSSDLEGVCSGEEAERTIVALEDGPPEVTIELRGTITIVDELGNRFKEENGILELYLWDGSNAVRERVEFERGLWRATIPAVETVRPLNIFSGKRTARVRGNWRGTQVPDDGVLDVVAQWRPASTLVVKSAATGQVLHDVTLAFSNHAWDQHSPAHPGAPGDRTTVFESERSPVALEYFDFYETALVASPGHAWGQFEPDFDVGGEHVVTLRPAGDLRVVIEGGALPTRSELRLCELGKPPRCPVFWLIADGCADFTIRSLPVGEFRVLCNRGRATAPWILDSVVEIVAGETRTIRVPNVVTVKPR